MSLGPKSYAIMSYTWPEIDENAGIEGDSAAPIRLVHHLIPIHQQRKLINSNKNFYATRQFQQQQLGS
jgi:hypothetical protein